MEQIKVKGMTCQHCVSYVTETLTEVGLGEVKVDLDSGDVSFNNNNNVSLETIKEAVTEAGYEVE